jgi:hypothetical protein
MSAEEPIKFPAIKPLRDVDRFSKSTYPIDAKLLDGQQPTALTKHRVGLLEPDYFANRQRQQPLAHSVAAQSAKLVREDCEFKKSSERGFDKLRQDGPINGFVKGV